VKRAAILAVVAACSTEAPLRDYDSDSYRMPEPEPFPHVGEQLPELRELQERRFVLERAGYHRAFRAIARVQPAARVAQFFAWEGTWGSENLYAQWTHRHYLTNSMPQIADHPEAIARWRQAFHDAIPGAEQRSYERTMLSWLRELDGWIEIRLACVAASCVTDRIDVHGEAPAAAAVRASTLLSVQMDVRRRVGVALAGAGAGTAWAEPWFELAPDGALTVVPGVRRWPGIASADAGLAASGITGLLRAAPAAVRSP
jgi:hypothetical protein